MSSIALETVLPVSEALLGYADCLDQDRLEDWPQCFVPEGVYRVVSRENEVLGLPAPIVYLYSRAMMMDRVTAIRDALTFEPVYTRHVMGMPRVWQSEAGLRSETSFSVYQTTQEGRTRLYAVGQYQDLLEENPLGGLLFRERRVVLDTFAVYNLMALPL